MLKPVDLIDSLRAGVEHIYAGLDRKRGCRPYFGWDPIGGSAGHSFADSPHVVGRFLDVLGLCAGIFDMPVDDEAIRGMTKLMEQAVQRGKGLAMSEDHISPEKKGACATMHDQREGLLALIALMTWRRSKRAAALAENMIRRIDQLTAKTGHYPGYVLTPQGWEPRPEGADYHTPADIGRFVGALVKYFRVSGNPTAITLARRFADYQLEHCFDTDGRILEPAGTHLHSLCGTCSGIIDLGLLEHDYSYVQAGKRIYDVGLMPYRTSYGWVKESRSGAEGRGEPNNTADIVEAALYLGQAGYPDYFEDAETMVRNLLLRCQIWQTDWVGDGGGQPDTFDRMNTAVRDKIRGAYYFPTPNDFHSYNTDLTGAVMQGLCETWHTIGRQTDDRLQVDLLLSRRDAQIDVDSRLPQAGDVRIKLKRAGGVTVRIPPWVDRQKLRATVNGRKATTYWRGTYLAIDALKRSSTVRITFGQPERATSERVMGWPNTYRLRWKGNTVMSIRPKGKVCPLFPES